MIVKNEESTLPRCLDSVKDVVDEIVIVDTGSADNTIKIAEGYNAKVFHFDWINDFSAARNFALKNSTGDFILYLDADEILKEESKEEIKTIIRKAEKIGYLCTITSIDNYSNHSNSIQYVRFFKNSDKIYFQGKAHEQITDSLLENGYKIQKSNIEIIHFGYDIPKDEKKAKAERNLKLLLSDLEKNPTSYNYFQIGQSYFVLENYSEAEKYFKNAISLKTLSKDLLAECYSYLAQIYHFNFDVNQTEEFISKAISINNKQPYYYYLLAKAQQRKLNFNAALSNLIKSYELNKSLEKSKHKFVQSVQLNNDEVLVQILDLALKLNNQPFFNNFSNELIKQIEKKNQNKLNSYKVVLNLLKNKSGLNENLVNDFVNITNEQNINLFSQVIDFTNNINLKLATLNKLVELYPDNVEILKRIALSYDALNQTDNAIKFLNENFEKIENDASILFYLASFYIKKNNYKKALEIFDFIEKKFPNISSLTSKIREIREKILSVAQSL